MEPAHPQNRSGELPSRLLADSNWNVMLTLKLARVMLYVERVLIRQHGKLDLKQIRAELKPLLELKGAPESLDKLEQKIVTVKRRLKAKP